MPFYGGVRIQAIVQSEHDMLQGMAGVLGLCVHCQCRRLVVANFQSCLTLIRAWGPACDPLAPTSPGH
jgi:hypothetical protein